jgi:tetratricopeptide (TPR) repeat protein
MSASRRLRLGVGLALVVGGALVVTRRVSDRASDVFPPPSPEAAPAVAFSEFMGAEACAECHQDQYQRWATSTHGRAGGEPSPELVIAPFDGTPIGLADGRVIPRVTPQGDYQFLVQQAGHADQVFPVDGVIGGGHMVGGGTQGFVTRVADGTVRFLPFDWSRHEARWFCNTGTRAERGWVPITPDMTLADCGDWPPLRVLGTVERFADCQGCHGSQILTDQPPGQDYRSRYTSLAINCESCHGPGRRHVELAESGRLGLGGDLGLASLGTVTKDGSLDLCFQCHALKDVVREGHLPGASLEEHYALKFPILGDDPFFPDFRVKTFAYQGTHLSSPCYLDGSMTCVSCHEPHSQAYQDEFGDPLIGRFDDGQCTSCHASKADPIEAHSFHAPDSEGSRCVACHMPYLQEPEVGPGVPYARSDHTIPLPRPRFDASLGVESACIQCHADRSADALQAQAEAWWGELKPHRSLVDALVSASVGGDREAAARDLLRPDLEDPLAQFAALSRFLLDHLGPDDPNLEPAVAELLWGLEGSPDLDVRALALASLHWARGHDRDTRQALVGALAAAEADGDALRQRWVLGLSFLGDEARAAGDVDGALLAYRKVLELVPEDGRVLGAMGAALNQSGDYEGARAYLLRSVAARPDHALSWVNLGIAQAGLSDVAAATESYATAARSNPNEPLAFFNLGNLYLRQNALAEAALSYERAVELDPGLARGHYNLARVYIQLGRYAEALPRARRALELEPTNQGAAQMLRDLQRAVGSP